MTERTAAIILVLMIGITALFAVYNVHKEDKAWDDYSAQHHCMFMGRIDNGMSSIYACDNGAWILR